MTSPTPISAVYAINPAFQHAKQQLLQPFHFSQWLRLAFVGLLAGEMGSGLNIHAPHHNGANHFRHDHFAAHFANHPGLTVASIAFFVALGLAFFVLILYISSVMRFILFDSILAKECHIRQGWARRSGEGLRLFGWQLLLTLAGFASLFLLIGVPVYSVWSAGWFAAPREHLVPLILGGVALFLVLISLIAAMAFLQVLTKDFLVPQMALENIGPVEAWKRLWSWLKGDKAGYAGYIVMKIVLAIAAGIILGIITVVAVLIILIPFGGIGIGAFLVGKAAGWAWTWQTIAAAITLGVLALAAILFAASLISVPAIVFFPAYGLHFLAPRYAPLAAILYPQSTPPTPPLPA
jgi:hypothetical protein